MAFLQRTSLIGTQCVEKQNFAANGIMFRVFSKHFSLLCFMLSWFYLNASAKWRASYFAYFTCLTCSCVWRARVLYLLACLECFTCSHAWRAHVFYELGELTCLVFFTKWRALRASQNRVLGLLLKMICLTCLAYLK